MNGQDFFPESLIINDSGFVEICPFSTSFIKTNARQVKIKKITHD